MMHWWQSIGSTASEALSSSSLINALGLAASTAFQDYGVTRLGIESSLPSPQKVPQFKPQYTQLSLYVTCHTSGKTSAL